MVLAAITDPEPIAAILGHLDLPTQPPPIAAARAPPQLDWLIENGGHDVEVVVTDGAP